MTDTLRELVNAGFSSHAAQAIADYVEANGGSGGGGNARGVDLGVINATDLIGAPLDLNLTILAEDGDVVNLVIAADNFVQMDGVLAAVVRAYQSTNYNLLQWRYTDVAPEWTNGGNADEYAGIVHDGGPLLMRLALGSYYVDVMSGWEADHAYEDSAHIIEAGHVWSINVSSGTSGSSRPDFEGSFAGDTSDDGTLTGGWSDNGALPTVGSLHLVAIVIAEGPTVQLPEGTLPIAESDVTDLEDDLAARATTATADDGPLGNDFVYRLTIPPVDGGSLRFNNGTDETADLPWDQITITAIADLLATLPNIGSTDNVAVTGGNNEDTIATGVVYYYIRLTGTLGRQETPLVDGVSVDFSSLTIGGIPTNPNMQQAWSGSSPDETTIPVRAIRYNRGGNNSGNMLWVDIAQGSDPADWQPVVGGFFPHPGGIPSWILYNNGTYGWDLEYYDPDGVYRGDIGLKRDAFYIQILSRIYNVQSQMEVRADGLHFVRHIEGNSGNSASSAPSIFSLTNDIDPTVGDGLKATYGSLYVSWNPTKVWQRGHTGADTDWSELASGASAWPLTDDVSADGNRVTDLGQPFDPGDAANKEYVDDQIAAIPATAGKAFGVVSGLDMAAVSDGGVLLYRGAGSVIIAGRQLDIGTEFVGPSGVPISPTYPLAQDSAWLYWLDSDAVQQWTSFPYHDVLTPVVDGLPIAIVQGASGIQDYGGLEITDLRPASRSWVDYRLTPTTDVLPTVALRSPRLVGTGPGDLEIVSAQYAAFFTDFTTPRAVRISINIWYSGYNPGGDHDIQLRVWKGAVGGTAIDPGNRPSGSSGIDVRTGHNGSWNRTFVDLEPGPSPTYFVSIDTPAGLEIWTDEATIQLLAFLPVENPPLFGVHLPEATTPITVDPARGEFQSLFTTGLGDYVFDLVDGDSTHSHLVLIVEADGNHGLDWAGSAVTWTACDEPISLRDGQVLTVDLQWRVNFPGPRWVGSILANQIDNVTAIPDPTVVTPEDLAIAFNDLLAKMKASGEMRID